VCHSLRKVTRVKTIRSTSIACLFSLAIALPALADRCAYVNKEQALSAVSQIDLGDTIYELCEPCGDTQPTPVEIRSLAARTVDYEDFWEVAINNNGIDLAYVFIESGIDSPPINLAAVSGCSASDVSPVLPEEGE
jgi:hypothetical protein